MGKGASCLALPSLTPNTPYPITWNNGNTSLIDLSFTGVIAEGTEQVTGVGPVTSGEFRGASSTIWTVPDPRQCLTSHGLTSQAGTLTAQITRPMTLPATCSPAAGKGVMAFVPDRSRNGMVMVLPVMKLSVSGLWTAPVIAGTRLRGGSAHTARGASRFAAQAIGTAWSAGCTGLIVVRMDRRLAADQVPAGDLG